MIIKTFLVSHTKFDALTIGPIIFIKPEFANDKALIVHEQVHVAQFKKYWGFNGLLYIFSNKWKLKFESEGYAAQWNYSGRILADLDVFSKDLSENYNLGISFEQAKEAILAEASK